MAAICRGPGGWNPPGSSRLLSFTRMTTLYTVTPLVSKGSILVYPSFAFTHFSSFFPSPHLLSPDIIYAIYASFFAILAFYISNITLKMNGCYRWNVLINVKFSSNLENHLFRETNLNMLDGNLFFRLSKFTNMYPYLHRN